MDFSKFKLMIRTLCLGLILGFFTAPVFAVHDEGVFELDGDAANGAAAGDDWALMTADTSNSPIKVWSRSDPNFSLGEIDSDTRELLMTCDFAVGVGTGPQPDGFVGGEV